VTDLKLMSIKDLLPITGTSFVQGLVPRSISIKGLLFSQAQEVFINGSPSPEFMAVSDQEIIAQIPFGMENSTISQLAVLAESPSKDRSSLLHFEIGKTFKPLRGIERLVQLFCKILMQTPGSDRFAPSIGGGLLALAGQNIDKGEGKALSASISGAVSRTRDQIIGIQNKLPRTPPDERLLNASTEAVGFDASTTTAAARVSLTAVSGRQAVANLTF